MHVYCNNVLHLLQCWVVSLPNMTPYPWPVYKCPLDMNIKIFFVCSRYFLHIYKHIMCISCVFADWSMEFSVPCIAACGPLTSDRSEVQTGEGSVLHRCVSMRFIQTFASHHSREPVIHSVWVPSLFQNGGVDSRRERRTTLLHSSTAHTFNNTTVLCGRQDLQVCSRYEL